MFGLNENVSCLLLNAVDVMNFSETAVVTTIVTKRQSIRVNKYTYMKRRGQKSFVSRRLSAFCDSYSQDIMLREFKSSPSSEGYQKFLAISRQGRVFGMSARQVLWFFDYWSLLFGFSIFAHERNSLFHYWNRIRGLTIFLGAIISAYSSAKSLVSPGNFLYELASLFFFCCQAVYILVLHLLVKQISDIFNHLFSRISFSQCKVIRTFCNCLTCLWILIHFWYLSVYLYSSTSFEFTTWQDFAVFVTIVQYADHNFHCLLIVILMVTACFYSCKNLLKRVKSEMLLCRSIDFCCMVIISDSSSIQENMSFVNSTSGPALLLVLGYTFFAVSGTVSFLVQGRYGTFLLRIAEVSNVVFYCLAIFSLVVLATVLRNKLESNRKKVICQLLQQQMSEDNVNIRWKLGLEMLSDCKLFQFSVMSLFVLDLNLVLHFTASILTFSILFLQLQS